MNKLIRFIRFILGVFYIILTIANSSCLKGSEQILSVTSLRCEYKVNPLGIDVLQPRFIWILESKYRGQEQYAYQILVSSSIENLTEESADIWNSGKVVSKQTVNIPYQGRSLLSGQRCFWKVRAWNLDSIVSEWSNPAWWEMALLNEEDWNGIWINDGKFTPENEEELYLEDPAPLFRKEFKISQKVKSGRLYISGLGYYEGFLNGNRVGDLYLDPGWTNYSKRVFYQTYDVTDMMEEGDNCIGVTLGNGWYNPLPLRMWGHLNLREHLTIGRPRFILQLDIKYEDGSSYSIVSDTDWKVAEGPILKNNIYLGEVYDARKELPGWNLAGYNDSDWRKVTESREPKKNLQSQPQPPIRATTLLKTVNVTEPKPGIFIFDMGQNFAGLIKLMVKASKGTDLVLRYGELLNDDGTLNPMTSVCGQIKGKRKNRAGELVNIGGAGSPEIAWQQDIYIAKGLGLEEYIPRFTFHAFRYVELTGYPGKPTPDMIVGTRLNSDVKQVGVFSCSNEMLNKIQQISQWTFLSNIFSVQSDCPHRERFSYGGDIVSTSEAFMFNYDMSSFYAKTVRDWHDSAMEDGMLTDTAPYVGIQYCGVGWAMIHPLLQLQLYQYYGNKRLLEEQYETSRKWLNLVSKQNENIIIESGLSDHESLEQTPSGALVTPLYYKSALMLSQMANILKNNDDAAKYANLAEQIKDAYLKKFFIPDSGKFIPGTQASQSFSLYNNLVPSESKESVILLLKDMIQKENQGYLTTGIIGTKYMLDVLSREGFSDVAYQIVNQKDYPGWGYMLENGATTLWEHWQFSDNTFSHNHPMFGSVGQWFYNWLGGIQPAPDAVAFDKIILRPQVIEDLDWVKCSYNSIRGKIMSNWQRHKDSIIFDFEIPVNTSASVYLPSDDIKNILENNKPLDQIDDIHFQGRDNGSFVFLINSGIYSFQIQSLVEQN